MKTCDRCSREYDNKWEVDNDWCVEITHLSETLVLCNDCAALVFATILKINKPLFDMVKALTRDKE